MIEEGFRTRVREMAFGELTRVFYDKDELEGFGCHG